MANLSSASPIGIGLLLVLICLTTGSTGADFSLEEEFLQLKENYFQMKELVKSLESKVTELETKVQRQDSLLTSLLREKNDRAVAADFDSVPISTNQSAVAISGLPSSCSDLKMIGHIWSGFYSVMGSSVMESVYCDFTKPIDDAGFEKWIGYDNVKSTPVYFFVQRTSPLSADWPYQISFNSEILNVGSAMNIQNGVFIAPRPGIYFFLFNGLAKFPASSSIDVRLGISLQSNAAGSGSQESYVSEANTVDFQRSPLALQSILSLKTDDYVLLRIVSYSSNEVQLYEANFLGFMLEEEIVVSL
ncbi:uncharacterized protein LOC124205880 [Daphnia pulex]|uniref:uncharacterized protein LOC124205880 n=1 Tax=Daphnia pulex TaxID=6669 RepID=UPI001EDF75C9|nr:uncharacterized protein LOC124205880 [Daphnia pulex]